MKYLIKNLKPYWFVVIILTALLAVQGFGEMSMPQYTQDIIDTGIQNRGVEHILPTKVKQQEYNEAQMFMSASEKKAWKNSYKQDGNVYVLNASESRLDKMDDQLLEPIVLTYQLGHISPAQYKAMVKRQLKAAAEADFVIVLYNPVSRTRLAQYQRACAILSETLPEDRVCAYVRNIGRDGQKSRIFLLNELAGLASGGTAAVTVGECGDAVENANVGGGCASAKDATADSAAEVQPEIDMLSTIFVGNSETRVIETPDGPRMVTPRGYERKRVLDA